MVRSQLGVDGGCRHGRQLLVDLVLYHDGVAFGLLVHQHFYWRLREFANSKVQLVVLEELLRFDSFYSALLFKFCELIDVPVVAEVAESGGEHHVAVLLEGHEHLLEDAFVEMVAVDEPGSCDKVELPSQLLWESVEIIGSAELMLHEVGVAVFLLGEVKHLLADVDSSDVLEITLLEMLSDESGTAGEVEDLALLRHQALRISEMFDMIGTFFWVVVADSLVNVFIDRGNVVEVLLAVDFLVFVELLHGGDMLSSESGLFNVEIKGLHFCGFSFSVLKINCNCVVFYLDLKEIIMTII